MDEKPSLGAQLDTSPDHPSPTDSWTHNKASNIPKVANHTLWQWANLLGGDRSHLL